MTEAVPKPGSPEAGDEGCVCPALDNCRGRGRGGDGERFGWIISQGCPLHAPEEASRL